VTNATTRKEGNKLGPLPGWLVVVVGFALIMSSGEVKLP
jgi:hypothetical protein